MADSSHRMAATRGIQLANLAGTAGSQPDFGLNRPDIWVSALFEWVAIGAVLAWIGTVALILAVRDRLRPV